MITSVAAAFFGAVLLGAGFAVGCAIIDFIVKLLSSLIMEWLEDDDEEAIVADIGVVMEKVVETATPVNRDKFKKMCRDKNYNYCSMKRNTQTGEIEKVLFSEQIDDNMANAMGNRRSIRI